MVRNIRLSAVFPMTPRWELPPDFQGFPDDFFCGMHFFPKCLFLLGFFFGVSNRCYQCSFICDYYHFICNQCSLICNYMGQGAVRSRYVLMGATGGRGVESRAYMVAGLAPSRIL